jgi:hypothetical protein
MHRLNRTLSVAVVAFALAGPVFAGDVDWDFSAELMTGYDSNPLKLADDAGGGYTEGSVDFEVKADVGYRKELSARLRADTRLFAGEVSNADETHGSLDLGFEWVPIKEGHRRLILDVGADLDARRKTFTSRATGDVFEVDENGTPVPIPERFDSDVPRQRIQPQGLCGGL